jgi:hypothetical protein
MFDGAVATEVVHAVDDAAAPVPTPAVSAPVGRALSGLVKIGEDRHGMIQAGMIIGKAPVTAGNDCKASTFLLRTRVSWQGATVPRPGAGMEISLSGAGWFRTSPWTG